MGKRPRDLASLLNFGELGSINFITSVACEARLRLGIIPIFLHVCEVKAFNLMPQNDISLSSSEGHQSFLFYKQLHII
jgi:hypothetical protein